MGGGGRIAILHIIWTVQHRFLSSFNFLHLHVRSTLGILTLQLMTRHPNIRNIQQ